MLLLLTEFKVTFLEFPLEPVYEAQEKNHLVISQPKSFFQNRSLNLIFSFVFYFIFQSFLSGETKQSYLWISCGKQTSLSKLLWFLLVYLR